MDKKSALVFDLETKRSPDDVAGGWNNKEALGISVAGVYDYLTDELFALEEHELGRMEELLASRDLVIGFNLFGFDYPVLQPYLKKVNTKDLNTVDMIVDVEKAAGFRVGLNNLAKNSFGAEKSADGLLALRWFKEGKIEEVKKYCLDDVRITRDLYEYGKNHGIVRFNSRTEGLKTIPAGWAHLDKDTKKVNEILDQALANKAVVEIDYVSSRAEEGEAERKKRDIEIHTINGGTVEAYCHYRGDNRKFKIWRIMGATIKEGSAHTRPTLF